MKCLLLISVLVTGCVSTNHQILVKSTVFGLQIGASPLNAGIPQIQFGLVRNSYISNPTDTNKLFVAPLESHVKADIGLTVQTADETIIAK